MEVSGDDISRQTAVTLTPIDATMEAFADYGQVIEASEDGEDFGPRDAQLDLSRGVPRFYIMRLKDRELKFGTITHHASVTQCLGAVGGGTWYLGVAKSSILDDANEATVKQSVVKSPCGHLYVPPEVNEVRVFKIEGSKFLKLHRGTWHAGPLFLDEMMDFYNLELSSTNVSSSYNFTVFSRFGFPFTSEIERQTSNNQQSDYNWRSSSICRPLKKRESLKHFYSITFT